MNIRINRLLHSLIIRIEKEWRVFGGWRGGHLHPFPCIFGYTIESFIREKRSVRARQLFFSSLFSLVVGAVTKFVIVDLIFCVCVCRCTRPRVIPSVHQPSVCWWCCSVTSRISQDFQWRSLIFRYFPIRNDAQILLVNYSAAAA